MASTSVARLPTSCSCVKDDLPTTVWMTPVLSTRNSTRPPFASRTALATSKVTVPDFGFGMSPPCAGGRSILARDLHTHRACGALDHLHRRLDGVRVEVRHLRLGDRSDLRARQLPHLVLVRLTGAFLDPGLLTDQVGGRRTLGDERVRAVLEDGDHRGHDRAGERRRALVVFLDELPHVDAVRAERRADGRGGGGLPRLDLHLHDSLDLLRHLYFTSFSIWRKSSSTGVSRPKIDTRTFTLLRSGFTSSTTPWRSVNGPSVTRTASPFVNATLYFGASSLIWRRIALTSPSVSGVGCVPIPTKLVTPGVLRTTYQESSPMIISTST